MQDRDPLGECVGEDARQVLDVTHENIERERELLEIGSKFDRARIRENRHLQEKPHDMFMSNEKQKKLHIYGQFPIRETGEVERRANLDVKYRGSSGLRIVAGSSGSGSSGPNSVGVGGHRGNGCGWVSVENDENEEDVRLM